MDNLTPITREEMLMNDEPLTPITREEKILAGEDLTPVTRREYFLKKYRHAGGDVMVEGLEVTANGTYTAPEGKAYSPVEVAVPLPDNAYLLKTASGSLVSFSDGADLPMPSFICNIDAVQDLHGYDGPWVGGAGKNKLPYEEKTQSINGATFTINSDGTVSTSGTATSNAFFTYYKPNLPTGEYKFFSNADTTKFRPYVSNATKGTSTNSGGTFIADEGDEVTVYLQGYANQSLANQKITMMICKSTETDTTFAPYSNICPISGWDECKVTRTGKNLFDKTTITENKIINNNTGEETTSYGRFSSDYIKVNSSTDYYASNVIKSAQWYCAFYYDKNKNYLSCGELSSTGDIASGVITTPSNCNYVRLVSLTTYKDDVSFVVGNQPPTTYEPYNGSTYTTALKDGQGNPMTCYGGTLDVVSGVLTVDRASIKLNDLNWIKQNTVNNNWRFKSSQSIQNIKIPTSAAYKIDNLCSVYRNVTANETWTADNIGIAINADASLLICDLNQADTTALGVVIANQTICYELATPITYQLTPTQIKSLKDDITNAWCSTGDIEIDYFAKEVTG